MRLTRSYATTKPPRSAVRKVVVETVAGSRWDVYEVDVGGPSRTWVASFADPQDAEDFRRKRVRLPWRISSAS